MRSRVSIVEFSERMTVINFDAINTAVLEDNDWRDKLPFGVARQSEQSGSDTKPSIRLPPSLPQFLTA